jgi:hypothetical protein
MLLDQQDRALLARMVEEYPAADLLCVLEGLIAARADTLSDQGIVGAAKEASLVAWHLHCFSYSG